MNTAGKEVKYSKTFDSDSLAVKVNGVYDYDNNVPYFGFKVLTTSGVSSPANSNGFSVCKKFTQNLGPIKATADVQTLVQRRAEVQPHREEDGLLARAGGLQQHQAPPRGVNPLFGRRRRARSIRRASGRTLETFDGSIYIL